MTYERTLVRQAVVRNFILGVERSDSPDDGLGAVRQYINVQLVLCLQRSLVRHNGIAVDHSSIEKPQAACILLLTRTHNVGFPITWKLRGMLFYLKQTFYTYGFGFSWEKLVQAGTLYWYIMRPDFLMLGNGQDSNIDVI